MADLMVLAASESSHLVLVRSIIRRCDQSSQGPCALILDLALAMWKEDVDKV